MPNAIFFYFLFNNFYQKNFKSKSKANDKAKALNDDNNNNDSNNNESKVQKDLNKKRS